MGEQPSPAKPAPSSASKQKKRTATTDHDSPPSLEPPDSSPDHSTTLFTQSHTNLDLGQENGNEPGASFDQTGVLDKAPVQSLVETDPHVPLPTDRLKPKIPLRPLKIVPIMHSASDQARIDALCNQERQTVTIDGGNTASSQLSVLDAIERLHFSDGQANRIWSESKRSGGAGKRKIVYHCNQCKHQDLTAQKARQHFVSCHVEEAGWLCPVEGCDHDHKHKRLDDMKTHHMVPTHKIKYYRGREPLGRLGSQEAGRSHPYPIPPSNRRHQDSERTLGPHRTNVELSGTARNARVNTGPLSIRLRPRRQAMAPVMPVEHHESPTHVNEIPSPSMNHSPAPRELGFGGAAQAGAFSPVIEPREGTSRSNPILTGDFPVPSSSEPPHSFSPSSLRSQFSDHAHRQPHQGEYYLPTRASYSPEIEGPLLDRYNSISPQYPRPGSHVPEQNYTFPVYYPHDEELARLQTRDGQPGHDPPQQDFRRDQEDRPGGYQGAPNHQAMYINEGAPNSPIFPIPDSPYAQYPRQQQPMTYGGPGSSHASPPHVITSPQLTHNHATAGSASPVQPQSWSSYPVDGRNFHHYGQPSTSHEPSRRLPDPNASSQANGRYPSNQLGSPSHGPFPLSSPQAPSSPNRAYERPLYNESNPNPGGGHFNSYYGRPPYDQSNSNPDGGHSERH